MRLYIYINQLNSACCRIWMQFSGGEGPDSDGVVPSYQTTWSFSVSILTSAFFAIILFRVSSNVSPPAGSQQSIVSFTSKCKTRRGATETTVFEALAATVDMSLTVSPPSPLTI